jgi:hypothetical protein
VTDRELVRTELAQELPAVARVEARQHVRELLIQQRAERSFYSSLVHNAGDPPAVGSALHDRLQVAKALFEVLAE